MKLGPVTVDRQFVGFVLAGGAATLVNYTLFLVLLFLNVNYLLASAIGYASGIALSFAINRKIVFRAESAATGQLVRYFIAYGMALVAQLLLLEMLVRLGVVVFLANGIAIVVVLVANFFLIRAWVFGKQFQRDAR